jgi:hypothetical protein
VVVLVTDKDVEKRGRPGVSREQRISDEVLLRLERQLREGRGISAMVLRQWVARYGEPAKELLRKYDRDPDDQGDQ